MLDEKKIKDVGTKAIPHAISGTKVLERSTWRVQKPVIDYKKCIKCHQCWLFCPDSAYTINKKGYTSADPKTCKGCGICAANCPVHCIKMEREHK
jgi:pyruvate ferredoxin oxidoreductase delta subunit